MKFVFNKYIGEILNGSGNTDTSEKYHTGIFYISEYEVQHQDPESVYGAHGKMKNTAIRIDPKESIHTYDLIDPSDK